MSLVIFRRVAVAAATSWLCASGAHADTFVQTYEAPGLKNTTTSFAGGVETFDALPMGTGGFVTSFGGSAYAGTYSAATQINTPDQYGAADGVGKYAVTFSSAGYSISLNTAVNYFGYWLSALDGGNVVEFYHGASLVGSLGASAVLASIGSTPGYFGNPSGPFAGQNSGQPYAFVNFYDTDGAFDRIVFRETPEIGGYESDNHTVGIYRDITGTPTTPVPEPETYALMMLGLGAVAAAGRRRKR